MAIKFDELLKALDPSLDEYLDESLNNSDRVDFSTDKEAEEYIDNLLGD